MMILKVIFLEFYIEKCEYYYMNLYMYTPIIFG